MRRHGSRQRLIPYEFTKDGEAAVDHALAVKRHLVRSCFILGSFMAAAIPESRTSLDGQVIQEKTTASSGLR